MNVNRLSAGSTFLNNFESICCSFVFTIDFEQTEATVWRCSVKCSKKFCNIFRKMPVLVSLF